MDWQNDTPAFRNPPNTDMAVDLKEIRYLATRAICREYSGYPRLAKYVRDLNL